MKYFYIHCIILLSYQSCSDDFEDILKQIFILNYSKVKNQKTQECFESLVLKIQDLEIHKNILCYKYYEH